MASAWEQVLDAVVAKLGTLNLLWQGQPVPILLRKSGLGWPRIDTFPVIVVDGIAGKSSPQRLTPSAWLVPCGVRLQGIANGNLDLAVTPQAPAESTFLTCATTPPVCWPTPPCWGWALWPGSPRTSRPPWSRPGAPGLRRHGPVPGIPDPPGPLGRLTKYSGLPDSPTRQTFKVIILAGRSGTGRNQHGRRSYWSDLLADHQCHRHGPEY